MEQFRNTQYGAVCCEGGMVSRGGWTAGRSLSALVAIWYRRWSTRRHLAKLSLRELDDIGIDRIAADREAAKPFWMA